MKTRLVSVLGLATLLAPALAVAQAPDLDPNAPPPAPQPMPQESPQPAPQPMTVDPPPAQPPVVIVNPPPRAMVITETEPQYETYTDTWNAQVFASGAVLFLASYGASVAVAAMSEDDTIDRGNDRLYIPVAGPWLALRDRPDCEVDCDMENLKKGLLIADGVFQAGGVVAMVSGLLSPSEHRVQRTPISTRKVRVSPSAGGSPGLTLFGRF
ncbi:MAG: hypothetical protein M3619_28695 [Myxococcota bacterium]|nr:hypothetical protein [Myxococcota bacterium]